MNKKEYVVYIISINKYGCLMLILECVYESKNLVLS